MRLAFITWDHLDALSGGNLYDRRFIEAWRAAGVQVDVVRVRARGGLRDLLTARGAISARDYDVVVEDEIVYAAAVRAGARWRGRTPVVTLVHNLRCSAPGPLQPLHAALERHYLGGVSAALVNSEDTREQVSRLAALPVHVAPPGRDHVAPSVDEAAIEDRARAPGPLRVAFVANVTPHKGLHRLLRAVEDVGAPVAVDVVGRTDVAPRYVAELRARAAGEVTWHGALEGEALAGVLSRAQVMALPSAHEGFGIAYLDALAFGVPVLATDRGAPARWIPPDAGVLLDPFDVAAWAEQLRRLASERTTLARMSSSALARWREHPTWGASAGAALAWLRDVSRGG